VAFIPVVEFDSTAKTRVSRFGNEQRILVKLRSATFYNFHKSAQADQCERALTSRHKPISSNSSTLTLGSTRVSSFSQEAVRREHPKVNLEILDALME
jgi:hypothetical protein